MCIKQRKTNLLNFWQIKKCTCQEQEEIILFYKQSSMSIFFTKFLCDFLFLPEEKEIYFLRDPFVRYFLQRIITKEENMVVCWVDNSKIYEEYGWVFEDLCEQGVFVYILCEQ